jgi:hypothetical protein
MLLEQALQRSSVLLLLPLLLLLLRQVHEEEWSYIPVGGPLPVGDQPFTAFGAAANLVHPATGEKRCKLPLFSDDLHIVNAPACGLCGMCSARKLG